MKLKKIGASFIAGILLVVVCASCVTQTRVNFSTDVDGAEVFVDGEKIGTTPVQKKTQQCGLGKSRYFDKKRRLQRFVH